MRFAAHAIEGPKLHVYDEGRWLDALDKRVGGKRFWVELLSEAQIRSSQQNKYWWGVVVDTVAQLWDVDGWRWKMANGVEVPLPKEAVHDALVTAFGGGVVATPLGKARRRSTAEMSVEDFSVLIENVKEYALHKYQIVIPDPEEAPA